MATSRPRLPAYFGTRAHCLGSGGAGVGLLVAFFGRTGGWGLVVVGGLYGAGAVLGLTFPAASRAGVSPQPAEALTAAACASPEELAAALRQELGQWREWVAQSRWPAPDAREARRLVGEVEARIDPGTAVQLVPVVREAVPQVLDWYERGQAWWRLEPQGPPPGEGFAERVRVVLERLP